MNASSSRSDSGTAAASLPSSAARSRRPDHHAASAARQHLERARPIVADDRPGRGDQHVDVIELNEAFAAQALACLDGWGVDPADGRVNPNGGAIAVGHPLGCSGARLVLTLAHELRRRDASVGLATMCIGVGQGIAMVVERAA
jgi:hypothetical protein